MEKDRSFNVIDPVEKILGRVLSDYCNQDGLPRDSIVFEFSRFMKSEAGNYLITLITSWIYDELKTISQAPMRPYVTENNLVISVQDQKDNRDYVIAKVAGLRQVLAYLQSEISRLEFERLSKNEQGH